MNKKCTHCGIGLMALSAVVEGLLMCTYCGFDESFCKQPDLPFQEYSNSYYQTSNLVSGVSLSAGFSTSDNDQSFFVDNYPNFSNFDDHM